MTRLRTPCLRSVRAPTAGPLRRYSPKAQRNTTVGLRHALYCRDSSSNGGVREDTTACCCSSTARVGNDRLLIADAGPSELPWSRTHPIGRVWSPDTRSLGNWLGRRMVSRCSQWRSIGRFHRLLNRHHDRIRVHECGFPQLPSRLRTAGGRHERRCASCRYVHERGHLEWPSGDRAAAVERLVLTMSYIIERLAKASAALSTPLG